MKWDLFAQVMLLMLWGAILVCSCIHQYFQGHEKHGVCSQCGHDREYNYDDNNRAGDKPAWMR